MFGATYILKQSKKLRQSLQIETPSYFPQTMSIFHYDIFITFDHSWETFNSLTKTLGVEPRPFEKWKFHTSDVPSSWMYQLQEKEFDEHIDFINVFLDILEPKFSILETMGIKREDITISMVYKYEHQCNLEFHPQEMSRLGKSGIILTISCFDRTDKSEL